MVTNRFVWVAKKQVNFGSFEEFKKWAEGGIEKIRMAPMMGIGKSLKQQMPQIIHNMALSTALRSIGLRISVFPQCLSDEQLQTAFSKLEISEGK